VTRLLGLRMLAAVLAAHMCRDAFRGIDRSVDTERLAGCRLWTEPDVYRRHYGCG
jgi:hypothetical protein